MTNIDNWLFLLLGTMLGFLSSWLFWWITNHYVVPNILFSPEISKKKNFFDKKGWIHRVKIKNIGRRNAIDVSYSAILSMRGVHIENLTSVKIPTSFLRSPRINGRGGNRILRLVAPKIDPEDLSYFPQEIKEKHRDASLTIEDFFRMFEECYLVLHIYCYDEFSGARKLYSSKRYTRHDIRKGKFDDLDIVADDLEVPGWSE